ncbi:DUF6074 family protein [Hoeflea ulvae]|uniref:DUF6074 family protein n=1 Tax=Hoeflea ulvae TaxID=2983764 RepID=A0ABT3YG16_9HYPH|nr:DUF6074 family protein [Hoeflea ulvae]MCY0094607.1 DUF6074 family protein [Hoeflea ulvae]
MIPAKYLTRMGGNQMQLELDLAARVIHFPFSRRRDLVRDTAEMILREEEDEAVRQWDALIRSLTFPLLIAGVPHEEVRAEMHRFHDAVQAEFSRYDGNVGGIK